MLFGLGCCAHGQNRGLGVAGVVLIETRIDVLESVNVCWNHGLGFVDRLSERRPSFGALYAQGGYIEANIIGARLDMTAQFAFSLASKMGPL